MKFLHIADVHYGRSFAGRNPERRKDIEDTFSRIIDFAISNDVDFILCAGDLIESDGITMAQLKSLRDEIRRFKGKFYAVAGNHDPLGEKSAYSKVDMPDNFILFPYGFSTAVIGDLTIHAFSWNTRSITQPLEHDFAMGGKNILLIHADTAQNSVYLPTSSSYLRSLGMDYIALGHIHKPHFIAENIAYCGSPEPLDPSETGSHGFILCDFEEKLTTKFVPFSKTTYIDAKIEITPDTSDVFLKSNINDMLAQYAPGTCLRITLTGRYSPLAPLDTKSVENERVCIEDKTIPDFDFELLCRENEGNIIGKFIKSFGNIGSLSEMERRALEVGVEALLFSENANERNQNK